MNSYQVLNQNEVAQYDVITLAQRLLGVEVVSTIDGQLCVGKIVETEAYRGEDDRGCHAFGQHQTPKNKTMFEADGIAYVYKCYGIHDMLNVVSGPNKIGNAVLIRAIEPISGLATMQERRGIHKNNYHLTGGPGKVCQALGITTDFDGIDLCSAQSPVFLANWPSTIQSFTTSLRVGMSSRIKSCAFRPWRFYVPNNPWVSRPLLPNYPLSNEG